MPPRRPTDPARIARAGTTGTTLMLWFGALAGAIAWSLHLLVAYALVGVACATGLGILIDLTTLVTALVTVAGGVAASRNWRRPEIGDGGRLLAVGGMLLNGMFLFAILVEGYPNLVLGPCWYG